MSLPSGRGQQTARGSESADIDASEALPVGTRGGTRGQLQFRENASVYDQLSKYGNCPGRIRTVSQNAASEKARRPQSRALAYEGRVSTPLKKVFRPQCEGRKIYDFKFEAPAQTRGADRIDTLWQWGLAAETGGTETLHATRLRVD